MPNCDFYGSLADHDGLLSWLFAEGSCHVYELSSDYERPLRRFASAAEVLSQFDRQYSSGEKWKHVYLQLYVLGAGPPFAPERIALDPKACKGATYRYSASGWGLVQFYLGALTERGIQDSHTNHNTQKRAEAWAPVVNDISEAGHWNFKKITAFSARLNREIRKRGVGKLGSRPLLPGALELWRGGLPLLPLALGNVVSCADA